MRQLKKSVSMPNSTQFFVPFFKIDKYQHMVYGYVSTETEDSQGEIVEKEAIRKAWDDYMKFANIREMHQLKAVGVTKEYVHDDIGTWIGAKIVDRDAWEKIIEGVYKGFSIGGKVLKKVGNRIKELILNEISIVDRPSNPDAVFQIIKTEKGKLQYVNKVIKNPASKAGAKVDQVIKNNMRKQDIKPEEKPAPEVPVEQPKNQPKEQQEPKEQQNQPQEKQETQELTEQDILEALNELKDNAQALLDAISESEDVPEMLIHKLGKIVEILYWAIEYLESGNGEAMPDEEEPEEENGETEMPQSEEGESEEEESEEGAEERKKPAESAQAQNKEEKKVAKIGDLSKAIRGRLEEIALKVDALNASIAKVEKIEKEISSLKEQLEEIKRQPRASRPVASYLVEKGASSGAHKSIVDVEQELKKIQAEIDKTYEEAKSLIGKENPIKEAEYKRKLEDLEKRYFEQKRLLMELKRLQ
jgi:hypothetical protein